MRHSDQAVRAASARCRGPAATRSNLDVGAVDAEGATITVCRRQPTRPRRTTELRSSERPTTGGYATSIASRAPTRALPQRARRRLIPLEEYSAKGPVHRPLRRRHATPTTATTSRRNWRPGALTANGLDSKAGTWDRHPAQQGVECIKRPGPQVTISVPVTYEQLQGRLSISSSTTIRMRRGRRSRLPDGKSDADRRSAPALVHCKGAWHDGRCLAATSVISIPSADRRRRA